MREDPPDELGVLDARNHLELPATALTGLDLVEDVEGSVEMPAKQAGSPMTFTHDGKQYIVLAVTHSGTNASGELIAYALP